LLRINYVTKLHKVSVNSGL